MAKIAKIGKVKKESGDLEKSAIKMLEAILAPVEGSDAVVSIGLRVRGSHNKGRNAKIKSYGAGGAVVEIQTGGPDTRCMCQMNRHGQSPREFYDTLSRQWGNEYFDPLAEVEKKEVTLNPQVVKSQPLDSSSGQSQTLSEPASSPVILSDSQTKTQRGADTVSLTGLVYDKAGLIEVLGFCSTMSCGIEEALSAYAPKAPAKSITQSRRYLKDHGWIEKVESEDSVTYVLSEKAKMLLVDPEKVEVSLHPVRKVKAPVPVAPPASGVEPPVPAENEADGDKIKIALDEIQALLDLEPKVRTRKSAMDELAVLDKDIAEAKKKISELNEKLATLEKNRQPIVKKVEDLTLEIGGEKRIAYVMRAGELLRGIKTPPAVS